MALVKKKNIYVETGVGLSFPYNTQVGLYVSQFHIFYVIIH